MVLQRLPQVAPRRDTEETGKVFELARADRNIPFADDRDRHCLVDDMDLVVLEGQHGRVLVGHVDVGEGDDSIELADSIDCSVEGHFVIDAPVDEERSRLIDIAAVRCFVGWLPRAHQPDLLSDPLVVLAQRRVEVNRERLEIAEYVYPAAVLEQGPGAQ